MTRPTRRQRGPNGALRRLCLGALLACAATSCTLRDDAEVTLEFWTLALSPFSDYIEERIRAFEDDHPGVRVRWVDVPFNVVDRKLIAAAAADRAPDVVNMSDLMFARFAAAGAFADLSGLSPGAPDDRYLPGALDIGRIGDRLLALPWYLTTQTLLVNTRLLEQGGLALDDLPTSWAGMMDLAGPFHARTSDSGPGRGAFLFSQPLGEESQIPMMLLADGLAPFREAEDGRLRADLTRDEVVSSVERWVMLYRNGLLPRVAATRGFDHLVDGYQQARFAMINTGANFLGRVAEVSPEVYRATRIAPPVTGDLGRSHIAVMSLCVMQSSRHPEQAAALAWFMTSPESQLEFCKRVNILPSTPASLADPHFAGPTPEELDAGLGPIGEARALSARLLPDAVAFTPSLESWPDLRRAFESGIKRALLDGEPVGQALARIERDWDRILAQADERRAREGVPRASMSEIPTPGPVGADSEALSQGGAGR